MKTMSMEKTDSLHVDRHEDRKYVLHVQIILDGYQAYTNRVAERFAPKKTVYKDSLHVDRHKDRKCVLHV